MSTRRKTKHIRESRHIVIVYAHVPMLRDLVDCLRYDSCYPATEDESRKLWAIESPGTARPTDHLVRFVCAGRAENTPTIDRWSSFGCTVFAIRALNEPSMTDAELLAAWNHRQTTGELAV